MKENNDNIGALWIKENQKGDFYKGFITLENEEKINIVVFKNNYKKNEKQPDFQILKSKPLDADKEYEKEERKAKQEENNAVINENDLPF